jgi:hypothetical protein
VIEESKHEAVEEMYFWPTVRDKSPTGPPGRHRHRPRARGQRSPRQAGQGRGQRTGVRAAGHHDHPGRPRAHQLRGNQGLATAAHGAQRPGSQRPGRQDRAGQKTAPTRPHPRTPASPAALKTAGPAVAAADRARDAASGRGE